MTVQRTMVVLIGLLVGLVLVLPAAADGQAGTTLVAYKWAAGFWENTLQYDWDIAKSASPTSLEIRPGQTGWVEHNIAVRRNAAGSTQRVGVRGAICVTNGGAVATENLTLTDQVEVMLPGSSQFQPLPGAAQTISPAQLAPGATVCYDYEIVFTPVAGAVYRNTAKVTITNHSGWLGIPFGPEPKSAFSLPAAPTVAAVDAEARVTDILQCPPGFVCTLDDPGPWEVTADPQWRVTARIDNVSAACGHSFELANQVALVEDTSAVTRTARAVATVSTGVCAPAPPVSPPVFPPVQPIGAEGCTPGYWKNHVSSWVGYSPQASVGSVFAAASPFEGASLLQALDFGGGSGVDGAKQILLRAAVAALLNEAHPNVSYGAPGVVVAVNAALASNNRATMLSVKDTLDRANNQGCPIDAFGRTENQGRGDSRRPGKDEGFVPPGLAGRDSERGRGRDGAGPPGLDGVPPGQADRPGK